MQSMDDLLKRGQTRTFVCMPSQQQLFCCLKGGVFPVFVKSCPCGLALCLQLAQRYKCSTCPLLLALAIAGDDHLPKLFHGAN